MRSNQVPLGCTDVFCSSVWPRQVLPSVSPPPAVSRCGAWSVSGSQNPEFGLGSGQAMEDAVKKKREERSEPINTIQGQVAQGIFGAGPNEVSYNKVSPVVENTLEMVSQVVDSIKTKMEEQVLPHIPTKITETVQTYQEAAVDQVIAVVEKVCTFIHLKPVYQMCNFRLIPSLAEELTSSLRRSPSSKTPLLSSTRRPR